MSIKKVYLIILEHTLDVEGDWSKESVIFGRHVDSVKSLEDNFTLRLRRIGSEIVSSFFNCNSLIVTSALFDFTEFCSLLININ